MPKMKSKGAVKGRFRVTKSGKVKCARQGRGHYLAPKSGKQGRRLRTPLVLDKHWGRLIKKMLGG